MESKHWILTLFVIVLSYCLHSANAASKAFIQEKVDMLEASIKKDINDLRSNLASIKIDLQSDIANVLREVEDIQSKLGEEEVGTIDEHTTTTDYSKNENQPGNLQGNSFFFH